jgi:hypothetical protein
MKKLRILAIILLGCFAIVSSGLADVHFLSDLPFWITPTDGLHIAMGVAVGDIITEYGAYYEKGNQNTSRLLRMLMQPTETEKWMTAIKTDDTIYKLANGIVDDIVQPFQTAFTAKGVVTFTPKPIELHHLKADFTVFPDDIEATWLGFLSSGDLKRTDWPLIRFIYENYLIPKIKENLENQVIYKGVFSAPQNGVAGNTINSMDGIRIKLHAGVDDGSINTADLDPFTDSNTFDQIEEFAQGIPDLYRTLKMNIFCDPTIGEWYLKEKRNQGFYTITSEKEIHPTVDFTGLSLVSLPSMAGSGEIFATPKENFLHITKKDVNKTKFELQGVDRQVKTLTDWWEGVGFGINEAVWTNIDQDS